MTLGKATDALANTAASMSRQAPFVAWSLLIATALAAWLLYMSSVDRDRSIEQTDKLIEIQVNNFKLRLETARAMKGLAEANQQVAASTGALHANSIKAVEQLTELVNHVMKVDGVENVYQRDIKGLLEKQEASITKLQQHVLERDTAK